MTLTVVMSLGGAPGATTVAAALAARAVAAGAPALLLEADADGGVLAARHGLDLRPCLTDAAGAARSGLAGDELWGFARSFGPGVPAVVAHPSAEQTSAALRLAGGHLASAAADLSAVVVADVGRWRPDGAAIAIVDRAHRVVLVMQPLVDQVARAVHAASSIGPDRAGMVLVGRRPHPPRHVAEVTGLEVLAVLDTDPTGLAREPFAVASRRDHWSLMLDALVAGLARGTAAPPPAPVRPRPGQAGLRASRV